MTRSQINYILTLVKHKNFGTASNACFISQSTLSAMVAKFEEQIGIEIFNRKTRPIELTSEGQKIINALMRIDREYQLLDEQVKEIKGLDSGELSLACIPTVAPYLYPLILNKMTEVYPNVSFKIYELTTENIIKEIINGQLDVGIISTPLENDELLEYHLYNEEFLIYDCGDKANQNVYSVSDIDLERLWLLEEGHCMRNQVSTICELRQTNKLNSNLTYNCGSIFTLIEMVERHEGVTLIPKSALHGKHNIDITKLYKLSSPIPSRNIGLTTHKNFVKTKIIKNLSNLILGQIEAEGVLN